VIISAKYQIRGTAKSSPCSYTRLLCNPNTGVVYFHKTAGPVSTLRLLLKGKALQDNKLVKDYDIQDDATITIMSKPALPLTSELLGLSLSPSVQVDAPGGSPGTYPKHQRKLSDIPSVVLSPAGSPGQTTPLLPAQTELHGCVR